MPPRSPLPPPPPPVEMRSWPDRDALLRDRALVLGELVRMHIGPGRLGMLWLWAGLAALGWSFVGTAMLTFEESHDVIGAFMGLVCVIVGAGLLVPSAVFVALGMRRDRRVRRLLAEWGGLDRDPVGDVPLRRPAAGLVWMLTSYLLCAVGLYTCVIVPATARAGQETYGTVAFLMGLGLVAWLTGLIGVVKAFAHRRWVVRVLMGAPAEPPVRVDGGARH
ncbi:hypothetical protein [Streptomyces sp. NPDC001876]|uniref:hypothetical protein n=1 Tax=Streptomyces sp. NPDC001876 TaxID=3154402 RepID=UPI00331CDE93